MKKLLAVAAIILLASFPARADIVIGLAGPFSGESAAPGEQLRRGAEQAVKDINAKGGINGEKVVLDVVDDVCDPKQAVAAANKLASAGVKFVVGHYCSGAAIPASKVYMDEGMFMITPAAELSTLTDEANGLIFRTDGRDDQQALAIGQYILAHFAGKKVAIIHDQTAFSRGIADKTKETLNAGGMKEILFDAYTPGQKDYSALISKLNQIGTEVLFTSGYHTETGLIVRQLKSQNNNIQVIGTDNLVTSEFWGITGTTGEGVLMCYVTDPRHQPAAKTVLAAFRKSGFEPEGYTLNTYAGVEVIAEGIRRVGSGDTMKVAQALRQTPVKTVLGTLTFDAKGDLVNPKFVMYRWHNGTYTEVE